MRRRRGRSRVAIGTVRSTRGPLSAPLSVILAAALATVLSAASCTAPGGGGGSGGPQTVYDQLSLSYSGAGHQIFSYTHNGPSDTQLTVELDGLDELNPSDVFLVFTNTGDGSQLIPAGEGGGVLASVALPAPPGAFSPAAAGDIPHAIRELNSARPSTFAVPRAKGDPGVPGPLLTGPGDPAVGTDFDWKVYNDIKPTVKLIETCTLRDKAAPSHPASGRKTLVWVEDDPQVWSPIRGTSNRVDPDEVDAILEAFATADPAIYGMAREVVGAEWGSHGRGNLIPDKAEVHIVLYDIDWGAAGYFWAANNYLPGVTGYPTNEALVFFMDSTYAKDFTLAFDRVFFLRALAHEFQHMIHFYQKGVLRDAVSETWLNEMSSLVMEDLVSTHVVGPGYGPATWAYGRLRDYAQLRSVTTSLTYWGGSSTDYSAAYAFGGFLMRYAGAEAGAAQLSKIVRSSLEGMDAVDAALAHVGAGIDADEALRRWGASLAVDPTGGTPVPAGYGYPGGTASGYFSWGPYDLELEAASMHAYQNPTTQIQPRIYAVPPQVILGTTSVIWLYADDATGGLTADVSLPPHTSLSVVVSPK